MSKYVKVDDVMNLINTSNRGNSDYFIVDQIEELCMSGKTIDKQQVRTKAIDEFTEQLCIACSENTCNVTINGMKNVDILTLDGVTETIFEVAEKMKGGAT